MLREVDSIERILDDAGKTYVKYWECDQSRPCRSDLLRRQRELRGGEAR